MSFEDSVRYQPLKGLYYTVRVLILLARLPWLSVKYLFPAFRPRPSWSYKFCFLVYALREGTDLNLAVIGPEAEPVHLTMDKGDANGVWIEPVPELIEGEVKQWAEAANVHPAKIIGYWYDEPGKSLPSNWTPTGKEKVVFYMHGGAYVTANARPSEVVSLIPRSALESSPSIKRVFSLEYRLSVGSPFRPENPFPAALMDSLAGYNHLVNVMGYSPSNIVMLGDSAGAHLIQCLMRYLIKNPIKHLPVPLGIALISPYANIGTDEAAIQNPASSCVKCYESDYVPPRLVSGHYTVRAFTGPLFRDAQYNEYLAPASSHLNDISFAGFPKTLIIGGDAEILLDQIRVLNQRMRNSLGDMVTYHEIKDAVHDMVAFAFFTPFNTQAWQAFSNWEATL